MPAFRPSAGYSLIEILAALLVTAVGVLGTVAVHLNTLRNNHTADVRSQATLLAYDIADRMRANREAALSGTYDIALNASAPTGSSVRDTDLRDWLTALSTRLPLGDGIVASSNHTFAITVQWDESRIGNTRQADAGGSHLQTFVYVTEL